MAAVPVERCLLVAREAADRDARAEQLAPRRRRRRTARSPAAALARRRTAPAARRPSRASRASRGASATRSSRSVTWTSPPVSCQTSHESTVPNARPRLAAVAEQPLELRRREVRVGHEPGPLADRARSRGCGSARRSAGPARRSPAPPAVRSRAPRRRSSRAGWRSRSTSSSCAVMPASSRRLGGCLPATPSQISSASCSTQPGCGKRCCSSR